MSASPNFVVGLGASAGGLEALERFFDHAPTDSGGAFVVVMHLSRDFKSMLDELLARHTEMPVYPAEDGTELHANAVYVIQPATTVELDGVRLSVKGRPLMDVTGPASSVDTLFRSIAKHWRERGGGIIFSGSGSDGAEGAIAIGRAGGYVCAQAPETAKFDSMPVAAIATDMVSAVEAPEQLGHTVAEALMLSRLLAPTKDVPDSDASLASILKAVVGVSNLDASQYKHSTFERRVRRRMMDLRIPKLSDYAERVAEDEREANTLAETLLIGVTEFFRDPEAFQIIADQTILDIIRNAQADGRPARIWVPGCATGEEAYSLAMLFANAMQDMPRRVEVQIFATDVKREHLSQAARGEFKKESLEKVPQPLRAKYFKPINGSGLSAIDPDIRKMIVFAPHDVLTDPPFTRLDMISCRNMLIYFSVEAQQKILGSFAFGLLEKGYLFLGSSETIGGHREAFDFVDARNRIFRRTASRRITPTMPGSGDGRGINAGFVDRRSSRMREISLMPAYSAMLKEYAPPGLLVSAERELQHSFGDARRYLQPPEGVVRLDASEMVDEALKTPMVAGIERALRDKKPITFSRVKLEKIPEPDLLVNLTIRPLTLEKDASPKHVLVTIEEPDTTTIESPVSTTVVSADTIAKDRINELETELDRTREALQSTIEEIETTNEELQASNEELMSSNEELQSTNEELSSVNEELYSVNSEYHRQNDELSRLSKDFDLLLKSTEVGVVFLDSELNITRFTSLAAGLFSLTESDVGRSIGTFRSPFLDFDPATTLAQSMEANSIVEEETIDTTGTAWLIRAVSYPNRQGAVLTVINIGRLRDAEAEAKSNAVMLETIRSITGAFYLETDAKFSHVHKELGYAEFIGDDSLKLLSPMFDKLCHADDAEGLAVAIANGIGNGELNKVVRLRYKDEDNYRYVRLVGHLKIDPVSNARTWNVSGVDVHEVMERSKDAQEREVILEAVLRASPSAISYVDTNQRYRYVNRSFEERLERDRSAIVGKTLKDVLDEDSYTREREHVAQALDGENQTHMLETVRDDGRTQRLSVKYEPAYHEDGTVVGCTIYSRDVTRFHYKAEELENIDRMLANGSRIAQYAIYLVDAETANVEFANAKGKERLGLDPIKELPPGTTMSRLTPEWSDRYWKEWLNSFRVGQDALRRDEMVFDEDHHPSKCDLFVAILDDSGVKKALVRVYENPERIATLESLRERSRELATSNRDLEQFASVVAHDLRAPLRHINQFSDFLKREVGTEATAKALEYLDVIGNSAEQMSRMVEALLDYARLRRSVQDFSPVPLSGCIEDAVRLVGTDFDESKATIEIGEMPDALGDAALLARLFQNLISNTLQYRKADTAPAITVEAEVDEKFVRISFSDNGTGIDPNYSDKIFKLFQRVHTNSDHIGLGVGLATCRRICEIHKGGIELDPTFRDGARFIVSLHHATLTSEGAQSNAAQ